MDVKLELFARAISEAINSHIKYIDINADEIVNSTALEALNEIALVIQNPEIENGFDVVDEIIHILDKYNISTGFRHDF